MSEDRATLNALPIKEPKKVSSVRCSPVSLATDICEVGQFRYLEQLVPLPPRTAPGRNADEILSKTLLILLHWPLTLGSVAWSNPTNLTRYAPSVSSDATELRPRAPFSTESILASFRSS